MPLAPLHRGPSRQFVGALFPPGWFFFFKKKTVVRMDFWYSVGTPRLLCCMRPIGLPTRNTMRTPWSIKYMRPIMQLLLSCRRQVVEFPCYGNHLGTSFILFTFLPVFTASTVAASILDIFLKSYGADIVLMRKLSSAKPVHRWPSR